MIIELEIPEDLVEYYKRDKFEHNFNSLLTGNPSLFDEEVVERIGKALKQSVPYKTEYQKWLDGE